MIAEPPGRLGAFIRQQRELSRMSLRELARVSKVSNAYLSQVERGLHEPSLRVLGAVAGALSVSVEELLAGARAGREAAHEDGSRDVEGAIRADGRLTAEQQDILIATYRHFLG